MNKRFFDLLRLWFRNYFKHPVENIRQARPIVPGRLYSNFGNICKAIPYRPHERAFVEHYEELSGLKADNDPKAVLDLVRSAHGHSATVKGLQKMLCKESDLPTRCALCDFQYHGVPCPLFNELADGSTVCDSHRYVIIKRVKLL